MLKLYLDCDGVILDTISKSYAILAQKNITREEDFTAFFSSLDWDEFITLSGEIDNATSKIKKLAETFDVEILTHVNSDNEAESKKKYFSKTLPGINVNAVPKRMKKTEAVTASGAILVDDYLPNLEDWSLSGGIPVKFSDSGKKSPYITITDLLDLLNIDFQKNIKTKIMVNE